MAMIQHTWRHKCGPQATKEGLQILKASLVALRGKPYQPCRFCSNFDLKYIQSYWLHVGTYYVLNSKLAPCSFLKGWINFSLFFVSSSVKLSLGKPFILPWDISACYSTTPYKRGSHRWSGKRNSASFLKFWFRFDPVHSLSC